MGIGGMGKSRGLSGRRQTMCLAGIELRGADAGAVHREDPVFACDDRHHRCVIPVMRCPLKPGQFRFISPLSAAAAGALLTFQQKPM